MQKTIAGDRIISIDSINEYVGLANRTLAPSVRADFKDTALNAVTGLASETGEIAEIFKKHFFHGHPLDEATIEHLKKEAGDLMWYFALLCYVMNWEASSVLALNIEKLKARYPQGFSTERSINRRPDDL